eukprot:EG_transcript_50654
MSFLSKAQQLAAQFTSLEKDEEQLIWEATQEVDTKPAAKKGKGRKKKGLGTAMPVAEGEAGGAPDPPAVSASPAAPETAPTTAAHRAPHVPASPGRHHHHR